MKCQKYRLSKKCVIQNGRHDTTQSTTIQPRVTPPVHHAAGVPRAATVWGEGVQLVKEHNAWSRRRCPLEHWKEENECV